MRLTWDELLRVLKPRVEKDATGEAVFSGLSTDTRTLKAGEVFLALKGENFDGDRFWKEAAAKGASCFILSDAVAWQPEFAALTQPVLLVPDPLKALGDLAAYWRSKFSIPVLAITGSNGKTTTRAMTATLLAQRYRTHHSEGNLNNLIGAPQTLLRLSAEHEMCVIEMGMNHLGEIARLTEIAKPTHGLITNIGPVHLEFLGNLEGVSRAKGELFEGLGSSGMAFVYVDDPFCPQLAKKAGIPAARQITYGWKHPADFRLETLQPLGAQGNRLRISEKKSNASLDLDLPLPGSHNAINLLAAVAVARTLGVEPEEITRGVAQIKTVGSRSRVVPLTGGAYLYDDCYNANLASMRAALQAVQELGRGKRAFAVLGEMLELGSVAAATHEELGRTVGTLGYTEVTFVGEHAPEAIDGAQKAGMAAAAVKAVHGGKKGAASDDEIKLLAEDLRKKLSAGDWLLVKGSRGMTLERLVKQLTG